MATKFYFSSSGAAPPPVSPAFEADWTWVSGALRLNMSPTKDGSLTHQRTFGGGFNLAASGRFLTSQFISDTIASGVVFSSGALTYCQMLVMESNTNDNINGEPTCLKIYSQDGSTLRATLLSGVVHRKAARVEWLNGTLRNGSLLSGNPINDSYTTSLYDRLVLELGGMISAAAGASVTGTMVTGNSALSGDLGINETDTSLNLVPWFQIDTNITFENPSVPSTGGPQIAAGVLGRPGKQFGGLY